MLIPALDCGCEACCHGWYDVAVQVKQIAYDAIVECGGEGCCDDLQTYVTHGPNHSNPSGDYLAIWLAGLGFKSGTVDKGLPIPVAAFGIKLLGRGYPTQRAENTLGTVLPTPEEFDHAAKHFMGYAEAMIRAIVNAARQKTFGCGLLGVTDLRPISPSSGTMAYEFSVTVELDW